MGQITGRIIRILDKRTVIINLGAVDKIDRTNVFSILGKSEVVVDPLSKEVLGSVKIVKAKVKAQSVYPRFTIATSRWTEPINPFMLDYEEAGEGDLLVEPFTMEPWKAKTEDPVRVGDIVVTVVVSAPKDRPPMPKPTPEINQADSSSEKNEALPETKEESKSDSEAEKS